MQPYVILEKYSSAACGARSDRRGRHDRGRCRLTVVSPRRFSAGERPGLAEYTEAVRLLILALQDRGWSLCRVVVIIDQHAIDQQ